MISDLFTKGIKEADPEVYGTLSRELERQQNQIELIASENIASRSILNAQGSVCLLYTSPSPRDLRLSRMPSSA